MNFVSVLIKQAGFAPNSMENQNSTKHFPITCRLVKVVVLRCLLFSRLKYPPHLQKGFISWHVDCILSISREFAILRTCASPPVQRYVSKNLFTGFVAQVCAWDVTRRLPMALECSQFQAVKGVIWKVLKWSGMKSWSCLWLHWMHLLNTPILADHQMFLLSFRFQKEKIDLYLSNLSSQFYSPGLWCSIPSRECWLGNTFGGMLCPCFDWNKKSLEYTQVRKGTNEFCTWAMR